jgi:hypothetical protein
MMPVEPDHPSSSGDPEPTATATNGVSTTVPDTPATTVVTL